MSEQELMDDEFLDTTNKLIEIANEMGAKYGDHKTGVAFIYAAARYNAYIAASSVTSAEALEESRPKAIEYFSNRFRQLYDGNMQEYVAHFEEYMGSGSEEPEIEKSALN